MFSYSQWALDWLSKAAGHKYIKRVPYQSGGRMRYRYIYNVTHTHGGKHVLDPAHMKVGTKLMLDATSGAEVHGHIQSVSGDEVTFIFDDGAPKGRSVTMSKESLANVLDQVHGVRAKLDEARKKQSDVVAKLKESGASAKQIARAEARLKALGGAPKTKPDEKTERLDPAKQSFFEFIDEFRENTVNKQIEYVQRAMREDAQYNKEQEKKERVYKKFIDARTKLFDEGELNTEEMLSSVKEQLNKIGRSLPRGWDASNVADKARAYLKKRRDLMSARSASGERYRAIDTAVVRIANDETMARFGFTAQDALKPQRRIVSRTDLELMSYEDQYPYLDKKSKEFGVDVFDYLPKSEDIRDIAARGL
jgi:hypothetical protein